MSRLLDPISEPPAERPPADRLAPWIVVALTLLTMIRLVKCDFTWWDDMDNIVRNPWFNPPSMASLFDAWTHALHGLYVPLTYSAWLGIGSIAKLDTPDPLGGTLNPYLFHVANVVVYLISAWLVYRILRELVERPWPACFGALLFAVHPVQVESVGWISGMKDLLAGVFGLLIVWRSIDQTRRHPHARIDWLSPALLVLGILSKPSAAMTPLAVIVIERLILARSWKAIVRSNWLMLLIAAGGLLVARQVQSVVDIPAAPIWGRPFIVGDTLTFYLRQLVYPVPLGVDYGRRPAVILSHHFTFIEWIIPAGGLFVVWLLRRQRPWLLAGALVFITATLPVSGIATFQFQFTSTTADHYLYFAMLGVAIVGAFLINEYDGRSIVIASLVTLLLAARSIMQTFTWIDDVALFSNALEVNPASFVAHTNLGYAYQTKKYNDLDGAIEEYRAAIALAPDRADPHADLADVLLRTGDVSGAIAELTEAVHLRAKLAIQNNPSAAADHAALIELLLRQHRIDEARQALAEGESLASGTPAILHARQMIEQAATQPTSAPKTR